MKKIPLTPLAVLITTALVPAAQAHAQSAELEHLVVTATRTPTPVQHIGSSVTVISADMIQRRQFITLSDALRDVPGMQMVSSGNRGSQTSVFTRGSNSNHTLVLVDGIEMNDPAAPSGGYDFANFLLDDVESIEIVRGSQSVLYGADAIGGVVHIRTRKGDGALKTRLNAEIGNRDTYRTGIGISGGHDGFHYAATAGLFESDGHSIATRKRLAPGSQRDNDGYRNKFLSTRLGWQANEQLSMDFSARLIETKNDIDGGFDWFGNTAEDLDAYNSSRQLFLGGNIIGTFLDDRWQATLSFQRSDIERKNRNDDLDPFGTRDHSNYRGEKNKVGLQNDLSFWQDHLITVGAEYELEKINASGFSDFGGFIQTQQTRNDRSTSAFYLQDQIELSEALHLTLGMRHDDPEEFSSRTTYQATVSYQLNQQTRLRSAYGTGYKAPSLYELYGFTPDNFGSAYHGNPDLKAETSKNWEIGVDQLWFNNRLETSLTYFDKDIDNLITTVFLPSFDSTSLNEDKAEIQGLEATFGLSATDTFRLQGHYTYTRARDGEGDPLLRRARHTGGLLAIYDVTPKLDLTAAINYIGQRKDVDGLGARVDRGGYSVVNLTARYQLNSQLEWYGRLENATDRNYEPAYGFQAAGLGAVMGINFKL